MQIARISSSLHCIEILVIRFLLINWLAKYLMLKYNKKEKKKKKEEKQENKENIILKKIRYYQDYYW